MRRETIIRLLALVVLCGLVYYFSYDQGRRSAESKMVALEETVNAQEETIKKLTTQVQRLKDDLARGRPGGPPPPPPGPPREEVGPGRMILRLKTSRLLFDARLVLTLLEVDTQERTARLQINLVSEGKVQTDTIGQGQIVRFTLGNQEFGLLLEQVQTASAALKLLKF